jgi:hypothetical protein
MGKIRKTGNKIIRRRIKKVIYIIYVDLEDGEKYFQYKLQLGINHFLTQIDLLIDFSEINN